MLQAAGRATKSKTANDLDHRWPFENLNAVLATFDPHAHDDYDTSNSPRSYNT
jgi:hypothetical protein